MECKALIDELEKLVSETFLLWKERRVGFSWRHYYLNHTLRVRALALALAEGESGIQSRALALAALLHDITKRYHGIFLTGEDGQRLTDDRGFWKTAFVEPADENEVTAIYKKEGLKGRPHHESGAAVARKLLLRRGFCRKLAALVAEVIRGHLRVEGHNAGNLPPEADFLYDADTIDANLGLVAFYRNIQIHCGYHANEDLLDYLTRIPSWVDRKENFIDRLFTTSGKELGNARLKRKRRLCRWLALEREDEACNRRFGILALISYFRKHAEDPHLMCELKSFKKDNLPQLRKEAQKAASTRKAFKRLELFIELLEQEIAGQI